MADSKTNRAVVLTTLVGSGNTPTKEHFVLKDIGFPELKDGEVRLQTLYISVDPYYRIRMNGDKGVPHPFTSYLLNEPINGSGVGKVIESKNPGYHVGDIITAQKILFYPFQEYVVFDAETIKDYKKLDPKFPKHLISATIGWLGMPGLTAYFGVIEKGKPKAGQNIVISGGAGAVGSVAGQISKILGLKVTGIVGSQDKVDYVTKELGFDHAVIYKGKSRDELSTEIAKIYPEGVDIYFDNVGGEVSNAVLLNMKDGGRVPICGQISRYNTEGAPDALPPEWEAVVKKKNLERGPWFVVFEWTDRFDDAWNEMVRWEGQGKLKCRETHYPGIDNFFPAYNGLFSGDSIGKSIIDIVPVDK